MKKTLPLLLLTITTVMVQSATGFIDTFDDGNDEGWTVFDPLNLAGITEPADVTFPDSGYRLKGVVPAIPDGGPARVFTFLQDEALSDFYIAVDLVDWDDTINQAVGLIGRAGNVGLGETTAYVCNYDPNQSGSSPAGQFQINYVENEAAPSDSTMAAANIELIADHSYRMIFMGKGDVLTAALYDLNDLTRPVALIQTEEGDARGELYDSGFVGMFNFSRSDSLGPEGVCDATFDNFVREAANPHEATWPIISRGLPGIPHLTSVVPASGKNFARASDGVAALIDSAGESPVVNDSVALVLNGAPVIDGLEVTSTEDGTQVTYNGLRDGAIYAAKLTAATEAGGMLTHEWRFDTFREADLSLPGASVIEVENYNFESGKFLAAAGPGTYAEKFGEIDIDYFDFDTTVRSELRFDDFVETRALLLDDQREEIVVDTVRTGVNADDDHVVSRTEGGEWLNYTREFIPADYFIYLRAASRVPQDVLLSLVDDGTKTNQTLEQVGKFSIHSTVSAQSFEYFQLTDDAGNPAAVSLGGQQTLRLTIGGEDSAFETKYSLFMNYFMLIPAAGSTQSFAIQSAQLFKTPTPRFELSWNSIPGYNYSVEYGASPDAFLLELEDLVADDSRTTFVDEDADRLNRGTGFYRIRERQ